MSNPVILVTDDEKSIRNSLREILEFESYKVLEAEAGAEALEILKSHDVDLAILDIKMKGMDGIETLEKMKKISPELPVLMISGHGNIQIAVEATKLGAFDFIEKPPDLNRLLISIRNALDSRNLVRENREMREKIHGPVEMIGDSSEIGKIKNTIEKVAPSSSRVLITGENGTGKELVARSIHVKSQRSAKPFVEVNCAAIPAELLESELFGHEKGAFTGATDQRMGKFEQASGGTLFLDEIGDMSFDAQAKVLRALQENKIVRVGGTETIPVDVRVLAATNKNLPDEIRAGKFREDLYHRLNVIPIHVPPLRERKDDIPLIATWYLDKLGKDDIIFSGKHFLDEALSELKNHQWRGNVRELQNVIERLALLTDGSEIAKQDINRFVSGEKEREEILNEMINRSASFQEFKEEAEKYYLLQKLEENNWNVSQTAEEIDIQRSHIYNKMKKYNIER